MESIKSEHFSWSEEMVGFTSLFLSKKEVELKQRYDGVVGVDLGLRYNAVITLLYKSGKIIEVEFVRYRRHMHKIRMLWHRIDELKSMLPEGQRTSKSEGCGSV